MILKILLILIVVCIAAIVAYILDDIRRKNRNKMPFIEGFHLIEMTIVTLFNNGKKLNFLLDTGSNNSYISKSASEIKGLSCENFPVDSINVTGSTGNYDCNRAIKISLSYKDQTYSTELYILESLDESFKSIEETNGVQLHGILGTSFLQKYNFVIDFDKLVAYKKK